MSTFHRFEDIEAWQKARQLTREVYTASGHGAFSRDFGLKDQIRRAAISSMSNIAEGFERSGNGEFGNFLSYSKGSVGELQSQLYIALDQKYISEAEFTEVYGKAQEASRLIGGLMAYLRQSELRGTKFSRTKPTTRGKNQRDS